MMTRILLPSILGLGLLLILPMLGQDRLQGASAIEQAIERKDYRVADSLLNGVIEKFRQAGQFDTLPDYIPLRARVSLERDGNEKATGVVLNMVGMIRKLTTEPLILSDAYSQATEFFATEGLYQQAYDAMHNALLLATQFPANQRKTETARCEYNLGVYANSLGNTSLSQQHHRTAMNLREGITAVDQRDLYLSYNAMGSCYWYASMYDSARLFYEKALAAVGKMPVNPLNQYYRPANIQNNLAAIYSSQGQTTAAIEAMLQSIDNYRHFIEDKEPHAKKADANRGMMEAIDNLAGIYKEIGDYGKAGELLQYSYEQKKIKFPEGHPGIFISEILLGQHYVSVREYDKALDFLKTGLLHLEKANGDYLFWAADAYYNLAMAYENKSDPIMAATCYEKSEALYDESYGGQYDNVYMDFLRNASLFYAKEGHYEKATEKANKVYAYLRKIGEDGSLQGFYQLLNLAEINFRTNRYAAAIQYSEDALRLVNRRIGTGSTALDSVKMEVFKPRAILIRAKADFALRTNRDTAYLQGLADELAQALQVLERRKVLIDDAESINILMADNAELIGFAESIQLELYKLTQSSAKLDQFINLHESGLYNRIRSRLDKQKAARFANLPAAVQLEEQRLKAAIPASLQSDKASAEQVKDYVLALQRWEQHLSKVREEYPGYYTMRYASIFRILSQLQASIPSATTLVRYYFIDSNLYALVVDSTDKKLYPLDGRNLNERIASLLQTNGTERVRGEQLRELYHQLWAPFDQTIRTKTVMIIPDGALFNLSFEILTPDSIVSYKQLAHNSLLSRYNLTYHYSLFLVGNKPTSPSPRDNYVAFAPGFSDEIKRQYQAAVDDSVKLDYQYLSLLPQPNTNRLARRLESILGGKLFLDNASTQASFRQYAGDHKIIFIGTHAEYNNIRPELSRLIFAKAGGTDSNSLFLSDIYNCNLHSDLTLLTACESGRPGYQDGEGMVSLAHAFNYAGSRTILTGLWRIDEQSSSSISAVFMENLRKGTPIAEALRMAKLAYLEKSDGRLLAPANWAGLVILGENDPIQLEGAASYSYWVLIGAALLGLGGLVWFLLERKKRVR